MRWIPEPYPAAGGLAAAGFYKLLGRPRLDPLAVLVRETAQNSWDARADGGHPVQFALQGWHLTDSERRALARDVFVEADRAKATGLADELASPGLVGLYISDRNTRGLGGPLQADESSPDGIYDWVDFVLNVGKANTQGQTGGTYGFGKTISYVVSSANAIVIHTRTMHRGRPETRLIACAIGEEFDLDGRLYTGRHWWGADPDGTPLPVRGAEADRIATRIGMTEFTTGELGTNILVVAPDLGGRTAEQAMTFVAESVTWHLWPKLTPRDGKQPPMDITVSWNGEPVPIPRPEDRPPLNGFAQAFQVVMAGRVGPDASPGTQLDDIRCGRPRTKVGDLATVPMIQRARATVDDGSDELDPDRPNAAAAIVGVCHHVALLRSPELVVEYFEGPVPPEGGIEWAGVFRVCDEHDAHFAAAEPPTHDSWEAALLPKSQGRTIVNVGLRQMRNALEQRWRPRTRASETESASTALIADELAHLVRTVDAKGKGRRRREGGTAPSPRNPAPRVELISSGPIQLDDAVGTAARVLLTPGTSSRGTRLRLSVGAALEGGGRDTELDPRLDLVWARYDDGDHPLTGLDQELEITHAEPLEVEILVRRSADTTVLFELAAEGL